MATRLTKHLAAAAALLVCTSSAQAQLNIVSEPSERALKTSAGRKAQAEQSQSKAAVRVARDLPSRMEVLERLETVRQRVVEKYSGTPPPIPFSDAFKDVGCVSLWGAPAGVEKRDGGLNGTNEVLECGGSIALLYSFDYRTPLTQIVTIVDKEYASDPDRYRHRIKSGKIVHNDGEIIYAQWINPSYEYKIEIYNYGKERDWGAFSEATLAAAARSIVK